MTKEEQRIHISENREFEATIFSESFEGYWYSEKVGGWGWDKKENFKEKDI